MPSQSFTPTAEGLFLPDFCDLGVVFLVVLVGELLACVLALAPGAEPGWARLALVSLFVQGVALSGTGALCVLRPWLGRLGNVGAGLASYALLLLVTFALSELAYRLVASRIVSLPPPDVLGPVDTLAPAIRAAALGSHLEFLVRNLAVAAIVTAVALRYVYVQHQWKTNLESEARARVQALQSRIRPHFLFNSMNTIASLTRTRPELAEQVTEDLAELFRVSLSDASIPVTLGREIDICRQYLRIEEQRLGARLRYRWEVDGLPEDALLPALSLQPLVENAVYHGIEPAPDGGDIRVSGEVHGDLLRLIVSNTTSASPGAGRTREGHHMALGNVAQRLQAFFGEQARVDVDAGDGEYTVRLEFPRRSTPP